MKSKKFLAVFFAAVIVLAASQAALCSQYVEGEALAVFKASENNAVSASDIADSVHASIAETYETLSQLQGKVFVLVRSQTKTTQQLISELKQNPNVITASPNYYTHKNYVSESRLPDDPSADKLWAMNAIRAPEVWPYTTGNRDIYVCIIDSGMYRHPDLEANIAPELGLNTATVSKDYDKAFTSWDADLIGHGTHVAGTIGAVGNNGIGINGINWQVSMFSVRVFDSNEYETISKEIRAMNYIAALLMKNPDMKLAAVNMSLGAYFPKTPEEMKDDVYYMAFQALDDMNRTLIVVAAGNDSLPVGRPAPFSDDVFNIGEYNYPSSFTGLKNFITVGAVTSDDKAAYFTNWGDSVDISAPGFEILSTYSPLDKEDEMYQYADGTSMAAPHVTGAAALLMSAYTDATPAQIKAALLDGADKNNNPVVYPYAYTVERYMTRHTESIDKAVVSGSIPAESRDALIEAKRLVAEERFGKYKPFDGTGRVSRTGLLDIKAAYDLLGERINVSTPSSSSGGCSTSFPAVIVFALGLAGILLNRKR